MKKRVLITGGAGYIGSILSRFLLAKGYKVRVLDLLLFGKRGLEGLEVEFFLGDVRNVSREVLDDVDAVIHLAAFSNDPMAEFNPKVNFEINTFGTLKLANECKKKGIKRFIFASSASIYDGCKGVRALDETSKVQPKAPYSLSKFQAEKGLLRLADGAFSPVILRKGTVHGFSPRMRYDLVLNTFVKDALSKGRLTLYNRGLVWRPVIDIRDVALAYIFLLEADEEKVRGQIFNLALKNIQIKDLAAKTKEVFSELRLPLSIKLKTTRRQRTYQISTRKINNLGWKPIFSLETSIRDLIKKISEKEYSDFENPIYYNIIWVKQRLGW